MSISSEKITIWELLIKILDKASFGKNPPDEIMVIAKFSELKALIPNKFKIINMVSVIKLYNIKILNDCFNISALLKDIKFVKDFLKLSSKISINRIIENKK